MLRIKGVKWSFVLYYRRFFEILDGRLDMSPIIVIGATYNLLIFEFVLAKSLDNCLLDVFKI